MNSTTKIRVAGIGAGSLANAMHYPSLTSMPDVELVALCDVVETKLHATAEKFQIPRVYTDYRKMLNEVEPDAVYILMPPHHLFDLSVEVLRRKHHLFIEKPPGLTTFQTASLARLAEKNNCLTMTGFQRRYCPLFVESKRRAEERGPIIQCLARFVKSGMVDPFFNGACDILTSDGIHAVDMLRWMGGEVKKVSSTVSSFHTDFPDAFNALVEFESGAVGFLLTNWITGRRIFSAEMHSKNFSAYADPDDKATFNADGDVKGEIVTTADAAGSEEPYIYLGFHAENRHFMDCIKSGEQPGANFTDAIKTMELIDRIYRSTL
jgi:predicted dehydrogenase